MRAYSFYSSSSTLKGRILAAAEHWRVIEYSEPNKFWQSIINLATYMCFLL